MWNRIFEDTQQNRLYANVRASLFLLPPLLLLLKDSNSENPQITGQLFQQGEVKCQLNTGITPTLDRQLSIDVLRQEFLQRDVSLISD